MTTDMILNMNNKKLLETYFVFKKIENPVDRAKDMTGFMEAEILARMKYGN